MSTTPSAAPLLRTPLYEQHIALGARMVPFAGYEMPVNYPLGVLKEHQWTREKAGLFDISHMGFAFALGPSHGAITAALETLMPADIVGLPLGKIRYSQLLNDDGGIIDDLMVTRSVSTDDDGGLMMVLNASRKHLDIAHLNERLPAGCKAELWPDWALLALQGPRAADVLSKHAPAAARLAFMTASEMVFNGIVCHISRSGYTGEDGFEIAVKSKDVVAIADALLAEPDVRPIGLGARDSLRLEAGLCLYGHDIDETTSPVEADLQWSIQKRRRLEGGFPGADRVQRELADGPARKRVGIRPDGRQPAREGSRILDASGRDIGVVTSGGFGGSVNGPVSMGYVEAASAIVGTPLQLIVRDKPLAACVVALPFHPHRYKR
jgi:aminomethyltransferase